MNVMFIIYRTRFVVWNNSPELPRGWDVVCGSVWTEDEVRNLADKARAEGYLISSAEVPLAFALDPQSPPDSVFVPGEMAMAQDDPMAEEFSDFIPYRAYLTREEAEQGENNWDEVWEFPLPWISQFALSPFKLGHFAEGGMDPHKFSL
ncbi:hypothetical protein [Corynebacterium sp. A21]|uniref:hypothetical protein n=1 Tax=Corynebacterium sp. A21 TaxID=3457318 RepID=UPI003FD064E8